MDLSIVYSAEKVLVWERTVPPLATGGERIPVLPPAPAPAPATAAAAAVVVGGDTGVEPLEVRTVADAAPGVALGVELEAEAEGPMEASSTPM
ncbi:hypothetical protein EON62_05765, partial [archaeon]